MDISNLYLANGYQIWHLQRGLNTLIFPEFKNPNLSKYVLLYERNTWRSD